MKIGKSSKKFKKDKIKVQTYKKMPKLFKETYNLITNCTRELMVIHHLWKANMYLTQQKIRENKKKLSQLKKVYKKMMRENAEIKRTRWCYMCEKKAQYLNAETQYCYCCQTCEFRHIIQQHISRRGHFSFSLDDD